MPAPFSSTNKWRPFCSERCKNIDLGDWASERYRVPTDQGPQDEREEKEAPKPEE
jgi:endogenous inhibitor of DNA gyrase (YacG/DUF329 family)